MKLKAYIHAQWDDYDKKYRFQTWGQDMSGQASCGPLAGEHEFDFTPPPDEVLLNGQIAAYREEQKQIRAQAERHCNEIQQRINDLLCLEHKPETA